MVKIIPLSDNHIAYIDDEDYLLVFVSPWQHIKNPDANTGYAYRQRNARYGAGLMHRLILGVSQGEKIDHIDGNGLNNTKANLRICTHSQNMYNSQKPQHKSGRPTTSKYKGVFYKSDRNRPRPWMARIQYEGKAHYLGTYTTEEEAARAYDFKAVELHGEFARLNFPDN